MQRREREQLKESKLKDVQLEGKGNELPPCGTDRANESPAMGQTILLI